MNRIPSLDGIRAIAIVLVLIGHTCGARYEIFSILATLGVQIFFVLSGFLITGKLIEERRKSGSISLRSFYIRRAFRILPASILYIFTIFVLVPGARPFAIYPLTYSVSFYTGHMVLAFGHLWSLSVEEQFYLVLPVVLALCFAWRNWVAGIAIVGAWLFRIYHAANPDPALQTYLHYYSFGVVDSLAFGCLAAFYRERVGEVNQWLLMSLSFAIGITLLRGSFGNPSPWVVALWPAIPFVVAAWIVSASRCSTGVLNWKPIVIVGNLSYSLYIWQQVFTYPITKLSDLPLYGGMLAVAALASYYLVEQPMIELGKRVLQWERKCFSLSQSLSLSRS